LFYNNCFAENVYRLGWTFRYCSSWKKRRKSFCSSKGFRTYSQARF